MHPLQTSYVTESSTKVVCTCAAKGDGFVAKSDGSVATDDGFVAKDEESGTQWTRTYWDSRQWALYSTALVDDGPCTQRH